MLRFGPLLLLVLGCAPIDAGEQPVCSSHELAQTRPPAIQYLNFDGVRVHVGNSSDAKTNTSGIPEEDVDVPPFDHTCCVVGMTRAQAIQATVDVVADAYAPFNVVLTTERPPEDLDYSMTIVGGLNSMYCDGCNAVGVAPLDCADTNPGDVAFAFSEEFRGWGNLDLLAAVILQESAHAYGLGHTSDPRDYMYPSITGVQDRWARCTGPGVCNEDADCPDPFGLGPRYGIWPSCTNDGACCPRVLDDSSCGGEYQDSYETLMSMVGPAKADPFLPEVTFVEPTDLATVATSFAVEVEATDRVWIDELDPEGVVRVDVLVDGDVVATGSEPPWRFDLDGLTPAVHDVEAVAFDAEGNEGSAVVTVRVLREPECAEDADCGDGMRCASGLCGEPPEPPEEPLPETRPRGGGGCSFVGAISGTSPKTPGAATGALAPLLVLLALVRRRHRHPRFLYASGRSPCAPTG